MAKPSGSDGNSPCDSLAPLDDIARNELKDLDMFSDVIGFFREENALARKAKVQQHVQPQPQPQVLHIERLSLPAPQRQPQAHVAPQTQLEPARDPPSTNACPPRSTLVLRSHRPSDLSLVRTNGLTTVSLSDLRRSINNAGANNDSTTVQIPRPKADHLPKTPATPSPLVNRFVMGNNVSSAGEHPQDDGANTRSAMRNPVRMLRKSSMNVFFNKRADSKPPMPTKLTATVIQVQQQAVPPSLDGLSDDDAVNESRLSSHPEEPSDEPQDGGPPRADSTAPFADETDLQPLSATSTIRDFQLERRHDTSVETVSPCKQSKSEGDLRRKNVELRTAALSPSIPAPSPVPEDSPHKYGLKDRMDTPEVPESEEIKVVKARRRSSGLEVFQEAQSLQSASSFLNNLSSSRRRAESLQRSSEPGARPRTAYDTSRSSSRPTSALQHTYSAERCRGHNFKPSGFAYSRPLTMTQLKCYRNHEYLLVSLNNKAPVECAVCHIDDDREHFSCSWCALRMCRFCRKDLAENGMPALRERIRKAELGDGSPSSSEESLHRREVGV